MTTQASQKPIRVVYFSLPLRQYHTPQAEAAKAAETGPAG
jgi:hypothetical protein